MHNGARDSRDLPRLSTEPFDVLVIGGGAAGAATAREAALRGFSTALIEREDFSVGASAHCFKVVHGGIRYLQHADIRRLRGSCRERAVLLRIAPHLVAPLPFVIPTYGRGKSSRWFLGAGMLLYDALTADLNRGIPDPARRIRPTRFLDRRQTLELFPAITSAGLTGAAIFEDGQMHNPPRLVLAFASAASELGAAVANYVEAESLLIEDSRVVGVTAVDRLAGARFDIRARLVINAAGGWAEGLLQQSFGERYGAAGTYSRDTCFVVARTGPAMALAIQGRSRDADALLARPARHLFMVPWRDSTLIGVWHSIVRREPDIVALPRSELLQFLAEVNDCYPALELGESEVQRVDFGLVPFGDSSRQQGGLSFGKQSRLIDHRNHGVAGLISLINVRYTVARRDAFDAVNLGELQLGVRGGRADSEWRPLHGGNFDDFLAAVRACARERPAWFPPAAIDPLVRNYGSNTGRVLSLAQHEPRLRRCFPGSQVTHAEAVYAVREEKALRMSDVVFRRTELGTAGHPGTAALLELQTLLRDELAWSEQRAAQELALVERECARYLADRPRSAPQTTAHSARHSIS